MTSTDRVTKAEWRRRAEAWRIIACEYAAHQRKPYGVPVFGALRLREQNPDIDWGNREEESRFIAPVYNEFKGMPQYNQERSVK